MDGYVNGCKMDDLDGNNQHEKPTKNSTNRTVCIFIKPIRRNVLSSFDQAHTRFARIQNETKRNKSKWITIKTRN